MQLLRIDIQQQTLICFENDKVYNQYVISTGKNGPGEKMDSGCTPRGWHQVHDLIGLGVEENAVFKARQWTGEIYSPLMAQQYPERDWILTRIIQLDGLEWGRNKGGEVDTLSRYIYFHGTPDSTILGVPGSKGCIRLNNKDIIQLTNWIKIGAKVYIE